MGINAKGVIGLGPPTEAQNLEPETQNLFQPLLQKGNKLL